MSITYCPKVYAHRGSNTLAPENSKPAFDLALMEGADGFETDIQLSKDFTPMLWHDDDLKRIGMPSKLISDYYLEELELLDISLLCSEFHRFCGLLSLQDFLRHYFNRTPLLLELKEIENDNRNTEEKIKYILGTLTAASVLPMKVMMSSFDLNLLDIVSNFTAQNFLIANIDEEKISENLQDLVKERPYLKGVCLQKELVNKQNILLAKTMNLKTLVYTCNTQEDIEPVFESGIDIIISDVPGNCKKIVKSLQNK